MLQPKDLVNGYELLERLTSDATGEVWQARKPGGEPGQTVRLRFVKLWTSATEMRQSLCAIEMPLAQSSASDTANVLQSKVAELEAEVARLRNLAETRAESTLPAQPDAAPVFEPLAPPVQMSDTLELSVPGFITTPKRSPQQVEPLSSYPNAVDTNPKGAFRISGNVVKVLVVLLFVSSIGSIIAQTMRLSARARRNTTAPAAATVAPTTASPSVAEVSNEPLPSLDAQANDTNAPDSDPRPNKTASPVIKSQKLPGGVLNLVRIDQNQNQAQTQHSKGSAGNELYLGETEITRRIWRAVAALPKVRRDLSPAPWQTQKVAKDKDRDKDKDKDKDNNSKALSSDDCEDCAVSKVSWNDVQEFLARVNALPNNAFVLRLPTEAEWEMGCADCNLVAQSNIKGRGVNKLQVVRQSGANKLGLYDMYGNVWEWCQDVAPHDNERRIIRGGSWKRLDAWDATEEDYESYADGGFRVAATLRQ